MSRFHIHVAVADLQRSVAFYSAMFGHGPTRQESDYAKWELGDPSIHFAISARGLAPGLNHFGLQAEDAAELQAIAGRLDAAGLAGTAETEAGCCYSRSDKYWSLDPSGIPWESFHTLARVPTFDGAAPGAGRQSACCVPPACGGENGVKA